MPFAPLYLFDDGWLLACSKLATNGNALVTSRDALAPSSFLLLVVRPGAPSSVLAPSSKARLLGSF